MYDEIPYDHLTVPIGSTWESSWYVDDADTGLPADWTGWSGRMQIRADYGGTLLATLKTSGTRDGDLVFGDDGNLTATLPAAFTAALPETRSAVFDLELIDPAAKPYRVLEGKVRTTPEVTTDA